MLDKIKNYAEHYENEVRDISNQLRDEMMDSFGYIFSSVYIEQCEKSPIFLIGDMVMEYYE